MMTWFESLFHNLTATDMGKKSPVIPVEEGHAMENDGFLTIQDSAVNSPKHYAGIIEPIEAIEAWGLGFNLGNVCKYIARAGKKDANKEIEDLQKALYYLNREITNRLLAK